MKNYSFLILLTLFSSPLNADGFDEWSKIAQGRLDSPAIDGITEQWTGPDGKQIKLAVRQPVINSATEIIIYPVVGDARPVFELAIAKARAEKINKIVVTHGVYNFLSTDTTGQHMLFSKAKDLLVEGNGASLRFFKNMNGIVIRQSQRVRLQNMTLSFALKSSSWGTIDGSGQLVVDAAVTAADKIYQIAQVDSDGVFIPVGIRLIMPPGKEAPTYVGNQSYSYSGFSKITPGTRFFVMHQWYGGSAIKIDGDRDALMTEDITFSGINIHSTPGMAVAVTGLKRGFAFVNSMLVPNPGSINVGGPLWDGIHVSSGGGDILIKGNQFVGLGDDAINISNPINPVVSVVDNKLLLSSSSRFIDQSDELAYFNTDGGYLGKGVVLSVIDRGAGKFEFEMDSIAAGAFVVRDINLIASRYAMVDNVFDNLNVHGVLAQIPNGLISGNTFSRLGKNAIRLLSSIGPWLEGVGAFNVAVRGNDIASGGIDSGFGVNWAAITAYGQKSDGNLSDTLFNDNIEVSGNTITGVAQNCVSISNTKNAIINNNICN